MSTGYLILAHGSPDPRHGRVVTALQAQVAAQLPGPVVRGYLDHDEPSVAGALEQLTHRARAAVVVSLLFGDGFHADVDVPAALAAAPPQLAVTFAGPLGLGGWLHPRLDRLVAQASPVSAHPAVVLCGAGSSRPRARQQIVDLAARWAVTRKAPVLPAFATGEGPDLGDALAEADREGFAPVVVPLLLAEGRLSDQIRQAAVRHGATTTDVLGASPEVCARIVQLCRDANAAPSPTVRPAVVTA